VNYTDTLQWMFAQLPMYQRQGKAAFKKDLTNIIKLARHLKHPERQFKSIHVAGTNGKGSVSSMLASVLQEAGYITGLYTSPHLKDFRERIRVNGKMMRKNCVINFVKRNYDFLQHNGLSFFEMTVGMAFEHFAKQQVDIAVVEVGLGGRLDSTNIIHPELSVITNISMDHTQMLGDSIAQIAFEKAGIIKPGVSVVVGHTHREAIAVFKQKAKEVGTSIYMAKSGTGYPTDLQGAYQQENIQTVLTALKILQQKGFQIEEKHIQQGLMHVVKNTGLRGRWEILQKRPLTIADTAHNKAGIDYVMRQLSKLDYRKLHMVISVVNDKDLASILPLFPKDAVYYFAKANIPRGLDAQQLQAEAQKFGLIGEVYPSVGEAYREALQQADTKDVIFIGGSTFTVAEVVE